MGKRKRATLVDVAVEAGVSKTTVSQILNGRPISVSDETRQRVLKAVEKLNYTPNALIRALQERKTGVIGVVPGGSYSCHDWHGLLVLTLAEQARQKGYDTLLYSGVQVIGDGSQIRKLADGRCDGAIGVFSSQCRQLDKLAELELPVVQIGSAQTPAGIATVSFTDRRMACEATRYLLDLGHRRIAHLAGPIELWDMARERLEGYRQALSDAGVPWNSSLVWILPDWSGRGVADVAQSCLQQSEPPTAVVCCNKLTAVALREHARKAGIDVPGDLSVLALDDFGPGEDITAVSHSVEDMGRMAVSTLTAVIDGEIRADASHHRIPGSLIERDSCAEFCDSIPVPEL